MNINRILVLVLILFTKGSCFALLRSTNYSSFFNRFESPKFNNINSEQNSELQFEENKGQIRDFSDKVADRVAFIAEIGNTNIYLMKNGGVSWQFNHIIVPEKLIELSKNPSGRFENNAELSELRSKVQIESFRMDMQLIGANQNPEIISEGKSKDYTHYYNYGILDVHRYNKLTYKDIYPNIDWVIYFDQGNLKYDFIVRKGGDPSVIQLKYDNQEELMLDDNGSLIQHSSMGCIVVKVFS